MGALALCLKTSRPTPTDSSRSVSFFVFQPRFYLRDPLSCPPFDQSLRDVRFLDKNAGRLSSIIPRGASTTIAAFSTLLESHIAAARATAASGVPTPDLVAKIGVFDALIAQAREYAGQLDTNVLQPLLNNVKDLRKQHADALKTYSDVTASLGKEKERDEKTMSKLAWAAESARMDAWERGADLVLETEALASILDGSLGDPTAAPFDQIVGGTNVRCGYQQHLVYLSSNLHAGALDLLKSAMSDVCNADRNRGAGEVSRAEGIGGSTAAIDTRAEATVILDSAGGASGIEIKRGRGELALPPSVSGLESADEEGKTYLDNRYLRLSATLSGMSAQALKQSAALPPLPGSPYSIPALSPPPLAPPTLLPAARKLSILQLQMLGPTAALRAVSSQPGFNPALIQPTHQWRPLTLSISTTHCDICGFALLGIGVGTKCELCGVRCHTGACELRCQAKCPGRGQKTKIEEQWKNKRKAVLESAVAEAGLRRAKSHSRTGSSEPVSAVTGYTSNSGLASSTGPSAQAIYPYSARTSDELTLEENESVELLGPESGGWVRVRGRLGEGMVPMNYLRVNDSSNHSSPTVTGNSAGLSVGARVNMAYSHHAGGDAEISVEEGELVEVTGTEFVGDGWVRVRSASGAEGLVPASYLHA